VFPDNDSSLNMGVICPHGFERAGTTEKKFKKLTDRLAKKGVFSFRFDYTGCGLSDGDFRYTTVSSLKNDLEKAISIFKRNVKIKKLVVVTHSLSACVVAKYGVKKFYKIVLISPALNQKELLRYWFVKLNYPKEDINWLNYQKFLNEKEFIKYCQIKLRMTKSNWISNKYFLGNKDVDCAPFFEESKNKVLHIHGEKDNKVPLESLSISFPKKIIVKEGDHDLERPDMIRQWLGKTINFIIR